MIALSSWVRKIVGHLTWILYPFPLKHSDYNLVCILSFHPMESLSMKSSLSRTSIWLMALGLSCCAKKPTTTIPANPPNGNARPAETQMVDSPRIDSQPDLSQQLLSTKHPGFHVAGDSTRPQNPQLRTYHNCPDPSLDSAKAAKKRKESARKPNGQRPKKPTSAPRSEVADVVIPIPIRNTHSRVFCAGSLREQLDQRAPARQSCQK